MPKHEQLLYGVIEIGKRYRVSLVNDESILGTLTDYRVDPDARVLWISLDREYHARPTIVLGDKIMTFEEVPLP